MKSFPILAFFATLSCAQYAGAQYAGPKTVYILPMAAGFDQYLAQSLTKDHIMQVVADPKTADVVMTDRLGAAFEQRMKQIRPDTDKKSDEMVHNAFHSSRTQGTIFLVDAKSRQVLWSDYQKPPRSNSDTDLNRAAEQIAKKLSSK